MNIWEAFARLAARALEYVPVVVFGGALLYAVYLAIQLRRLRGTTLAGGALFRHPSRPLQLRYPPWWAVRLRGDTVEFESHEKDGILILTCRDAATCATQVADLVRETLDEMQVDLDDPEARPLCVNPHPGAHAGGFADKRRTAEAGDTHHWREERCYAAAWAFRGPRTIAILRYQCSVLYGMVDGYYHDLMMPTLRLDEGHPGGTEAASATDHANAPACTAV